MISRSCIWVAALTGMLCLLFPAAAGAATRFAAPSGSGTTCTEAAPCDIQTAVEGTGVASGDEVVLGPGTYSIGNNPVVAGTGVHVHGAPGAARPLIDANSGFVAVVVGAAGSLRDVEVHNAAAGIAVILIRGSFAERIISVSTVVNGIGCYLQPDPAIPPLLEQSACIATASGGKAVVSNFGVSTGTHVSSTMRNVTAVATGPASAGIETSSTGNGGSVTLQGVNVIASGTETDARAVGASSGSIAFTQLTFSNFDSQFEGTNGAVSDPGSDSNVTGPALLTNPAAGDVHQRPGSWTIDRGSKAVGVFDLDGEPRYQGAAPDIGADELSVLGQKRKCFGRRATILAPVAGTVTGTTGRDVIVGTAGPDKIVSKAGNDLICSLGGRDTIKAGAGADRARASGGGDRVFGETGKDRLLGGKGSDRLRGGAGKDLLSGQGGADRLAGGGGSDRCGRATAKDRVSGCE